MLSAALLAASLAAAPPLGPSAQQLERFKAYFTRGEELFGQGEYGGAIWNFRQADLLRQTPEVAFDLAKCHEKLGDFAYSTFYYRQYLSRAPSASDSLDVAERIGAALSAAAAEGRGLLEVDASGAIEATVAGQTFPEFPVAVFLPPGDHELTARFPSGVRKQLVQVRTGAASAVHFEPLPPPVLGAPETPAWVAEAPAEPSGKPSGMRKASFAVLGASTLALAAGTIFGGLASTEAARLKDERGQLTVTQARSMASSANEKGTAANLLWLAGAVGATGGGVMFYMSMPEPGRGAP